MAVESSPHDAVWLLVPDTTCVVHVRRRRTDSVKVPGVELVGFESGQDVAVGQVQASTATTLEESFVFIDFTTYDNERVWYRHKSSHKWTLALEHEYSSVIDIFTTKKNSLLEVDVDPTQWEWGTMTTSNVSSN